MAPSITLTCLWPVANGVGANFTADPLEPTEDHLRPDAAPNTSGFMMINGDE
jgi:hypothetical protein